MMIYRCNVGKYCYFIDLVARQKLQSLCNGFMWGMLKGKNIKEKSSCNEQDVGLVGYVSW